MGGNLNIANFIKSEYKALVNSVYLFRFKNNTSKASRKIDDKREVKTSAVIESPR